MGGKNKKGFTLVELIVVIVILAILIGVSITGVYSWVNKARVNTDINNCNAIKDALSVGLVGDKFTGGGNYYSCVIIMNTTREEGNMFDGIYLVNPETGDSSNGSYKMLLSNGKYAYHDDLGNKVIKALDSKLVNGTQQIVSGGSSKQGLYTYVCIDIDEYGNFKNANVGLFKRDFNTSWIPIQFYIGISGHYYSGNNDASAWVKSCWNLYKDKIILYDTAGINKLE